ncbi:MAG: type VI secretion system ImpA family N-terminal domain-containing protein [Bdellovibrionales bacterium]|nr:type VI secretion system ImpA family N-terminal domain-containing protein [Massilia sp.]
MMLEMDKQPLSSWLEPLPGEATGDDLEYDPAFLELGYAVAGKSETQFGAAEPPAWLVARELAESLFGQTRDLRVAMLWGRAVINLEGLEGLAKALYLIHGLLENFWDALHPRPDPDDGDTFARMSVLIGLDSIDDLLGDVRQSQLIVDRRLGGLRMRDVEIALTRLTPRPDDSGTTAGQITGMLGDLPDLNKRLKLAVEESLEGLKSLQSLINDRFGTSNAVEVKNLRMMLTGMQSLLPDAVETSDAKSEEGGEPSESLGEPPRRGSGGVGNIESRQDAVRAINLVCAYLERWEPTNPAQLLLRRAERLIDKNFLQLVRDLAPDAVNDVARILGVNPDSVDDAGSY